MVETKIIINLNTLDAFVHARSIHHTSTLAESELYVFPEFVRVDLRDPQAICKAIDRLRPRMVPSARTPRRH